MDTSNVHIGPKCSKPILGGVGPSQTRLADVQPAPIVASKSVQRKDACSGSDSQNTQPR
ncbi:hypothetical protein Hdeb2414_s0024g00654661 [Helianthus debilis subsp. tardiflorus]